MNGGKTKTGYTIVEVMIVLAISSMMFLAANTFISGRVSETNFRTGVNETASRIQDVIDQVSSGQYSDQPFICDTSSGSLVFRSESSEQGTKENCVYMGKIMYFNQTDNTYTIKSLAGKNTGSNNAALPDLSLAEIAGSGLDITVTSKIPGGIQVSGDINLGWILNPNGSTDNGDSVSQNLWFIDDQSSVFKTASGVKNICLTDGTRNAKLVIGENNNYKSVRTDFASGC